MRKALAISAAGAVTVLHYSWVEAWSQVPPGVVIYTIYLALGAGALLSMRPLSSKPLLPLAVLVLLGFVFAILSVALAEFLVGRADRISTTTLNAGYLLRMPFYFLGWIHLPIVWKFLYQYRQRPNSE